MGFWWHFAYVCALCNLNNKYLSSSYYKAHKQVQTNNNEKN